MSDAILLNHKDLVQPFKYRYLDGTNTSRPYFYGDPKKGWAMWIRPGQSPNRGSGFTGKLHIDKINVKEVKCVIFTSGFGSTGGNGIGGGQYDKAEGGRGGNGGYYTTFTVPFEKGMDFAISIGAPGRWRGGSPDAASVNIIYPLGSANNNRTITVNSNSIPGGKGGKGGYYYSSDGVHEEGYNGGPGILLPNSELYIGSKIIVCNGGGGQGGTGNDNWQGYTRSGGYGGGQGSKFPAPNGADGARSCDYAWATLGEPGTGNGAGGTGYSGCHEKEFRGTGSIGGFWMTVA